MQRKTSRFGAILALLYLLVAAYLFFDAWNCVTMLCDVLLTLWSMPTYIVTELIFGWFDLGDPSIANVSGFYGTVDVIAVILNLVGNTFLVYLFGFAVEYLLKKIRIAFWKSRE